MKTAKINQNSLKILDFEVKAGQTTIVHKTSLEVVTGQLHILIGPNGSGKSSLILGLAGHPSYQTQGKVLINNQNIIKFSPDQKVKSGLMITFQNPPGIKGVSINNLLKNADREINPQEKYDISNFYQQVITESHQLHINPCLLKRSLNIGFSGGEKKLMEMLTIAILKPKFILLDEIDTGLDIDALKLVAQQIKILQQNGTGILLVTHQLKLMKLLSFNKLYVMKQGLIVKTGKMDLLNLISKKGFENIKV